MMTTDTEQQQQQRSNRRVGLALTRNFAFYAEQLFPNVIAFINIFDLENPILPMIETVSPDFSNDFLTASKPRPATSATTTARTHYPPPTDRRGLES